MIMDIKERAKQYAEGKALETITSAIEQAYEDGYNAGYTDGLSSKGTGNLLIDGVEYVDLNLPSGTLWASDYLKNADNDYCYMVYDEAVKLNIPTVEQYKELIKICTFRDIKSSFGVVLGKQYIGTNGRFINILRNKVIEGDRLLPQRYLSYWLKSDNNTNTEYNSTASDLTVSSEFSGYGLPVMLVKQK